MPASKEPELTALTGLVDKLTSYQQGNSLSNPPRIHNYNQTQDGLEYEPDNAENPSLFKGNPNLRPNVGLTNSYENALFGWTWLEMVAFLRRVNLFASFSAVVMVALTWIFALFRLQFLRLVLSLLLAGMAAALWITEVFAILKMRNMEESVQSRVGLLYHPVYKSVYLLVMAAICGVIEGWWSLVLGWMFALSGVLLLLTWYRYPEFQQAFARDLPQQSVAPSAPEGPTSWSYYSNTFGDFVKETSERASLLGSSFMRAQQ
jgi:hypothetical protein